MRYRRFGKTARSLSVFSLGTMRCLASQAIASATVEAALAQGINHLETAQAYGESERFLGQALRELRVLRETVFVTTKITPTPDAQTMAEAIDRSLQRLNLDFVDGLALHGINTPEHLAWVVGEAGCWPAIAAAQQAGKIRHVGFSTHGSLDVILQAIASQRFAFVNLHYYYFFQRHAPAIALAHQLDMGIFIISPADKGGQLYTPPERLTQLCQPLSPLHWNYRFLLSDPRITTLSLGAAQPDELWPSLAVADQDGPLSPVELAIHDRLQQALRDRLSAEQSQTRQTSQTSQCSQCYQCLPCPADIHIPEVLRLRNLAIAYDMVAFGQYRYQMFENAGHWFPGRKANHCTDCGDCLPRCPEQLAIPDLLRDTHERLQGRSRRRLWG